MIKELFDKGELIRIPIDKNKVKNSLLTAEDKLEEAKQLFNDDYFNPAILSAYTSMFHAARALPYNEGIQEKGHFAVIAYLKERYKSSLSEDLLNTFEVLKKMRRGILYGFQEEFDKPEAETAILGSEDFLFKIRELLS